MTISEKRQRSLYDGSYPVANDAISGRDGGAYPVPRRIPQAEALARLGEGLAVGNLWHCNWSDPNDCRVTGMTRFATVWVDGGEPVAPVAVMRFDDSLYHILGDRLEGLTWERELILSADTYGGRSSDSSLVPGALVDGIELTL